MADWQLFTRNQFGEATGGIPAIEADVVTRRILTGKSVTESPYTPSHWRRLAPGCGLIVRRGGHTILSGTWTRRVYRGATAEQPLGTIALEGVTDDVIGQYRLCSPNPALPFDGQNATGAKPVWTMAAAPVETIMHALVDQNCGPSARPERRVPALVMGADQGRGPTVAWATSRYPTVQDELQRLAAYAEANGGVRLLPIFHQTELGLTFEVLVADDRTGQVVFGPGLGNLDDQEYTEDAGTVGLAIGAGKGEGAARMQYVSVTADEFTLAFGTLPEVYVDRRDTDDWGELAKGSGEAVAGGVAAVAVRCTALDTPGTRYGEDFDLNTLASVRIGPPGIDPETGRSYEPVAQFDDLVRELHFSLDPVNGTDQVKAAVGVQGAATGADLPSLRKLDALSAQLTQLQRSL